MAPSLSSSSPASQASPPLGAFSQPPLPPPQKEESWGSSFSRAEGFSPGLVVACPPGHLLHFANQCWRETSRLWALSWGFP